MIEYIEVKCVRVKLDGRYIGDIKPVGDNNGFAYYPKGQGERGRGLKYDTIKQVKDSL